MEILDDITYQNSVSDCTYMDTATKYKHAFDTQVNVEAEDINSRNTKNIHKIMWQWIIICMLLMVVQYHIHDPIASLIPFTINPTNMPNSNLPATRISDQRALLISLVSYLQINYDIFIFSTLI